MDEAQVPESMKTKRVLKKTPSSTMPTTTTSRKQSTGSPCVSTTVSERLMSWLSRKLKPPAPAAPPRG